MTNRFPDAWRRFWFVPVPADTLTLWRAAFGVTAVVWLLSIGPDLDALYGEGGLAPSPVYAPWRLGLFQWWESDLAIAVVYLLSVVAAVAVTLGWGVRLAAPALFLGLLSFQLDNTSVLNAGDELLRIWAAYLALYALLTPGRCTGVPLRGVDGSPVTAPPWLLRLVQVQLTIVYPFSVYAKLQGDTWWDGTAAYWALGLEDFERFPVPSFVTGSEPAVAVLTWGALLVEILVPVLLWVPRTRRIAIVAGVALHLSFDYALRVGFFGWAMTIGYLAFLTPSEAARLLRPFARRRPRTAPVPGISAEEAPPASA